MDHIGMNVHKRESQICSLAEGRETRLRRGFFSTTAIFIGLFCGLAIVETFARVIEPEGGLTRIHVKHPVLGWIPASAKTTVTTREYTATYDVNSLGMNDRPVEGSLHLAKLRIVALGDSNTFGRGVSQHEAWPKVLEEMLFKGSVEAGAVYNLGVIGYNVGQYLLRMRELQEILKPHLILIGFSMDNDLHDHIPPRHGGFVFGTQVGRVYFDLDEDGSLREIRELVGKDLTRDPVQLERSPSRWLSDFLGQNLAIYRRYRRSTLAERLDARFLGRDGLWAGIDTAMKKTLDPEDEYRWRLAEKIIQQIATEARGRRAAVLLVNIVAFSQVYDEVWEHSFGIRPEKYDRWIGVERLRQICKRAGIYYVDTTQRLVEEVRRRGKWLHYREDRHPTPEGHKLIAQTVLLGLKENGLLNH